MEEYEPETELEENIEISYDISILDEEYELSLKLNNSLLEFKLQQTNIIDEYYYKSKFELEEINRLLSSSFGRIKEVFDFFDYLLRDKKVKLIKSNVQDIIKLNFVNAQNNESNVELIKYKLSKDEINLMFMKEINILKKKLNLKNKKPFDELIKENDKQLKEYIDKKIEEYKQENQKKFDEKIKEKEMKIKDLNEKINRLKQEQGKKLNEIQNVFERKISEIENILSPIIEKEKRNEIIAFNKLNDNVNLINDFTNINVENMKNKIIVNNLKINWMKSVAVYKIIRNNEIQYELAYPDNKNTNIISKAHNDYIHRIKHYYDSLKNNHILLTSSVDKSIKLFNISSNPILNILHIPNCFNGFCDSPFCLMFNKDDYYILGGSWNKKKIYGITMVK